MRKMIDLDRFDRRLIELVCEDNLQPARALADKVGLSISAVLRRLRRLRDEGVIVALGGSPVELVLACDINVDYLQRTLEGRYVIRVYERFALRIKEFDSVCRITT